MPDEPPAPDSLPEYLSDGIPKQDNPTLGDIRDWADELLTYRRNVAPEEIDENQDESLESVKQSSQGTVVVKKVSCGKEGCRCQSGELHGPYKYLVTRQGDGLDWDYKGPVSE